MASTSFSHCSFPLKLNKFVNDYTDHDTMSLSLSASLSDTRPTVLGESSYLRRDCNRSFQLTGPASPSLPPGNLNSTIRSSSSISSVSSAPTTAPPTAPPTTPSSLIGGVVGGIVVLIGTIVVGTYICKRRAAIKRKETAQIKESS